MAKIVPKLINPIEKQFSKITRYHYYLFALIFSSKIPIFWHVLNLIFLSPPMEYRCNVTEGGKSSKNVCPCSRPQWDRSVFSETMQTKFGLFCQNIWLISFSHSMMYVGLLVGALVFGFLSDRFGRLSMFSLSCLILSISGCLVSIMPTTPAYIFMRTIEGIGTGGAIITAYVLCIEYTGVKYREIVTALFHIPVNMSHMTLPGLSYLLRHCDSFQLALSIPIGFYVAVQWMVMESPKWLMDSDQIDKAVTVMEKFAIFNGYPLENIKEQIEEYHLHHSTKGRTRITFLQIFKHHKITLNLIYMSVVYFLCGMGYYGVSQFIGKMSGNIHLNVAISGTLLLPGTIAAIFLLRLLNRRTFLMATMFSSGAFMMLSISFPIHLYWCRVVIACICNCFFSMSFIIAYLYAVELFPTSVRNSVLGMLSVFSRLGQIIAPPINGLSEHNSGYIFGALALFGTIFCFLLPETKNTELPSSLDDSKVLMRRRTTLTIEPNVSIS